MKRKLYILVALVLMLNVVLVYADTANNSQSIYLTLEDALKSIEKDNPDIKLMDRKLQITDRQYKDALSRANYAKDKTSTIQSTNIAYRKDELLNWKKSLYALNNLKHDRAETLRLLKSNLTKKYLDALIVQDEMANIQKEILNLDKNITQIQLKIKLGTARDKDLIGIQAQRLQLVSQLNSSKRQLDLDLMNIKKDLGISTTNSIQLSPMKKDFILFDDKNVDQRIAKAVEKSYTMEVKKQELELTKLEYNIIVNGTIVNLPPEVNTLEISIKDKEAAFEEEKLVEEASIWNAYYSLKNLEDDIQIKKYDVEIAQINLDTAVVMTKLGKNTELELSGRRLELSRSNNNLQRTINEYMLGLDKFLIQLGE